MTTDAARGRAILAGARRGGAATAAKTRRGCETCPSPDARRVYRLSLGGRLYLCARCAEAARVRERREKSCGSR